MSKLGYRLLYVLMLFVLAAAPVSADTHDPTRFVTLPPGPGHPEGMTNDAAGNLYVATFELTEFFGSSVRNDPRVQRLFPSANGRIAAVAANFIYVYNQSGALIDSTPMPAQVVPLGMVTGRDSGGHEVLYVLDVVGGNVLQYQLPLTPSSLPAVTYDVCGGFAVLLLGAPGTFCALNDIVLGADGRLYMGPGSSW